MHGCTQTQSAPQAAHTLICGAARSKIRIAMRSPAKWTQWLLIETVASCPADCLVLSGSSPHLADGRIGQRRSTTRSSSCHQPPPSQGRLCPAQADRRISVLAVPAASARHGRIGLAQADRRTVVFVISAASARHSHLGRRRPTDALVSLPFGCRKSPQPPLQAREAYA